MIRHVLAAVDLSETDTDVLRRADAIARHFSATLTALHVAESAEADLREGSARQRTVEEAIFSEARANFGTLTSRLGAQVSSDAMLVEAGERLWCRPPAVTVRSPVGAGDAFTGGLALALARGAPPSEALRLATGRGVVTGDGTVVRLAVQTICLHGDGPSAMEAARRVRARFEQEGITISAFAKG